MNTNSRRQGLFSRLRLSISMRLTLWYGLSMLILLSLFVIFLYASFHIGLHRDFEEQLRYEQRVLKPAVATSTGTPVLVPSARLRSVAYQTDGVYGTYVRLLAPDGEVLYQSPNFAGHEAFRPEPPATPREEDFAHTWLDDPVRTLYTPLRDGRDALVGWLEITRMESSVHREMHRLGWLLGAGIVLSLLVAIGSGHRLARKALRPVAELTTAANRIQAHNLDARLPASFGVHDELTNLADTFNAMLDRLEASFERERRFRADAAHEMFTPLSALQSEIDVALRKPRDIAYYQDMLGTLRGHVQRLSGLVEGLLQLSRAEAERYPTQRVTHASEVAQRVVERFRAPARARSVRLVCDLAPEVFTAVDPVHLEAILENLLDNAIKYTPAEGTVTVTACIEDNKAVLRVKDTGVGFTNEEASRLFDRFYRGTTRPVQQIRGSGLGLSITKVLVDAYEGGIEAWSPGPGRGSTFAVLLPLSRRDTLIKAGF